jgi:DNA-binding CsgD family transcriptional regulator
MRAITTIRPDLNEHVKPAVSFGYFAELAKSRDIGDLKRRVSDILKRLGFSDYAYVQLVQADTPQPALCTLSNHYIRTYFDCSLYINDMVLQKAINTDGDFFRSEIQDYISQAPFCSDMTRCMNNIYQLNKTYGYYDFYHIVVRPSKEAAPVMLTITQRGISPFELKNNIKGSESALSLLCEAIEFVLTKHFPTLCYSSKRLTSINPKPLRVLETLANNDLTIEQVADKLCISVVTANQHLKTVRNSLGTKTNYAAIKAAVIEKLIHLEKSCTSEAKTKKRGSPAKTKSVSSDS